MTEQNTSPAGSVNPDQITLRQPDDWHLHLRDGVALEAVIAATANQFARAIIMPNLREPVTDLSAASAYKERIDRACREQAPASAFEALMTLYLTDRTDPSVIHEGHQSGLIRAVKLYPAGATTNSDAGVTDLTRAYPALEAMQACSMPLLVHGEVTDPAVDVFDREARFIDQVLIPLRKQFPALKVVFEHITTEQAAHYVRDATGPLAATITPQHLLYNRNAIFSGGLRPHWYCLPVLKREHHRLALVEAATSGSERFFLGTDSAPHAAILKEHARGCAGCYSAPYAMALYATAFDRAGRLDRLEAFASLNGPAFYGLPVNENKVSLRRQTSEIAPSLPFGDQTIVPLGGGESIDWVFESQPS